ncbi:orotidine 5'-phosphate decarboxylase [Anaeromyxobacter dehalogenans 2CP-1]|uniref:Orotidine 5'-phosphate decarboxylase n=1 Tax=Anaeromyxobacter dehalogenans (strain ATCC BAA-258 / DSM 21875 / 2CP-1) TaxID=455488 RepID=PYRF_ANAD2|nr:orotidine-5'-phosphate decarboxylase [Anaeromyxobacter dehalogenans]B8J9L8.1 RecName: Full=Orotidine 5'-phosphate decarboxylase; AltName: Full=OMP decarboxylase; Short=OMPDCase; Short=OMPdecase [Anaeromyxobacter dehalogenans 2CP-1]ACL67406.1 orotidine 5'-phosphate decarboxylase [Anaeromyxobacter dehalogenans 2CP-1]
MKPSERICAALDFPTFAAAEPFARAVAPEVGLLKVGLELFAAEGPAAVRGAARLGRPVFLDLKLHDIPNTVEGAARSAAASGAALLTVHAAGGAEMVRAAVRGAGPGVRVLAVTVLTSLDAAALDAVGLAGPPEAAVVRLARLAVVAGAGGIVCSPHEVAAVRAAVGPGPLLVVPGVRPAGAAKGDQARVATPAEAVRAGADVIVVGRPLRDAPDPAAAARAIAAGL